MPQSTGSVHGRKEEVVVVVRVVVRKVFVCLALHLMRSCRLVLDRSLMWLLRMWLLPLAGHRQGAFLMPCRLCQCAPHFRSLLVVDPQHPV